MSALIVPDHRLLVASNSIVTPPPTILSSPKSLDVANKSIISHTTLYRHVAAAETEEHLRLVLAYTLSLLALFMDGRWSVDGTGMSTNGHFRYRKIRKAKSKTKDPDGPIYEEVGDDESVGVEQRNQMTWRDIVDVRAGWKRVVLIASHPFMVIGDVRTYDPEVGERAVLKDMLSWLKSLGLPLVEILADGGFNGTVCRSMIAEIGAKAVIPYPANAKRAVKIGMEHLLAQYPEIAEVFRIWQDEPARFYAMYSNRAKVENVFSVIKRRWKGIRCGEGHAPVNELLMIAIVVNMTRFLQLVALYQHTPKAENVYPSLLNF